MPDRIPISRRNFLQSGTLGLAAGLLGPGLRAPAAGRTRGGPLSHIYHSHNGTPAQNLARVFEAAYGGIENFIGYNDIVLLRPNLQWPRNGYTNTLVGQAMIDLILNRPGGFAGEIIVIENEHRGDPHTSENSGWCTSNKLSNGPYNWFELIQHYIDNAGEFPDGIHTDPVTGQINVSFQFLLSSYSFTLANPHPILSTYGGYSYAGVTVGMGPTEDPFLRLKSQYPTRTCMFVRRDDLVYSDAIARVAPLQTQYAMSYPVIKSQHSGLYVSYYRGHPTAWDPATETFTDQPVKLINMATLNHHGTYAGVTSIVKAHFGMCSNTFHNTGWPSASPSTFHYAGGAIGCWLATIRQPDLHMSCAERIGRTGRQESNAYQARSIAISTDPVALDYYVGKYILFPAGGTYGAGGGHATATDTNDPSLPTGYYGLTLEFCRDPLADHSIINGTLTESEMAVHYLEPVPGDIDADGDVDVADYAELQACAEGPGAPVSGPCQQADLDGDGSVDAADLDVFGTNMNGPNL